MTFIVCIECFMKNILNIQLVALSYFELRPLWVFPVQKQSQEACKWIYHKNIDMICETLVNKARFQGLQIKFKDVSNADHIWVKTVCSKYDETCVHRKCNKYETGVIPSLSSFEHLGEIMYQ